MWNKKGYNLHINQWIGRLGNNIQQICCAIFIAEKTESFVTWINHDILPQRTIDFRSTENNNDYVNIVVNDFFSYAKICGQFLPYYTFVEQRRICELYVRPLFDTLLSDNSLSKLNVNQNDLVIHIRSGDVFIKNSHPLYIQDPFSYYKTILYNELVLNNRYKRIILITEPDKKSPCIELIRSYIQKLNIDYAQQFIGSDVRIPYEYIEIIDFKMCIKLLLTAQNIILANSSFSQRLTMCNNSIKTMYISSLSIAEKQPQNPQRVVHYFAIHNYINHGEWTNKPEQINQMITHDTSDIKKSDDWNNIHLPAHFTKII